MWDHTPPTAHSAFALRRRVPGVPLEEPVAVARALASRGFNADREAVTLLANAPDPAAAIDHAVEAAPPGNTRLTAADVRPAIDATAGAAARGSGPAGTDPSTTPGDTDSAAPADTADATGATSPADEASEHTAGPGGAATAVSTTGSDATGREGPDPSTAPPPDPSVSDATSTDSPGKAESDAEIPGSAPVETEGSGGGERDPSLRSVDVTGDITGRSTGTGRYQDFVSVFRDRYERLSRHLKGRVNHRATDTLSSAGGGGEAGLVGMVAEIDSTKSGHWMIDLEDTRGTFPCLVMKDKEIAEHVDELLLDEVIAVEGSVSDDGSILFVDDLHFPDVPRTYRPNTADRPVQAALVSDVHVGSQEFLADAWSRFADWLHTEAAHEVEYLCIAGDMVEGVGVYPDQDEELDVVDIYDQYEAFAEYLKEVPGDMEIIMIPGNHDAVRLAEPQPGFDDELREIMSAHDPRIVGNPATVTIEGVDVLMYHGVSLDEVIAELPEEKASYEEPHKPMYQLLKKRHVAPQFGGHTRIAPEEQDYLVMDEVPDVFHTGHVHKFGYGKYRNVLAVNTGCWQAQTAFQESVNIDPDTAYAPVVDLHRLDEPDPMTIYDFN
ncbi:DNA-directed DNA polymerase II small subunit [Haloglomus irregulare]|uniref:DNA polymerase II small subunit n=1 Tax=Haloglomus irregulare TaxID=2234134 RepID=A0A554NBE7_9EURY|nr:DNA-directed DNA polymerase II small subunit [Haloglomus irregulare]